MSLGFVGPLDHPARFELRRRLGGGSMGEVFEAHDRATDARVALKTLAAGQAQFLAELKREFRIVQTVSHRNLVRLDALFQARQSWFFTMELVDGTGFLQAVRAAPIASEVTVGSTTRPALGETAPHDAGGTLRLDRLRHALPQLGHALATLHAAGLVHRDVKPSNVLVADDDRVVLLDFGLARRSLDDPDAWTLAGTPAYMAPEQARDGTATPASDCYAVGVMLYQALTGRLPFVGSLGDMLHRKRHWTPLAPSLLAPEVPAELEALCLQLLDPDPAARPTAADIVAATEHRSPARAKERSPARSGPPGAPFVGRGPELRAIRDAAHGTAVVVVQGESGIGKSALLAEAVRGLGEGLVLRGRCFEREVAAYAGLDMIIDELAAHLRRLRDRAAYFAPRHLASLCQIFPTLAEIPAFQEHADASTLGDLHEVRVRAAGAFKELFARLATRQRVTVVIDDAQWLSEASLLLVRALLAADEPVPITILLAARGPTLEGLDAWLAALPCPVTRVALGPLSVADSVALLQHHLPDHAPAALATMADDSAGHPYLLRELALAPPPRAHVGVDAILRDRATQLAPLERRVLDLVCAATGPVRQGIVAAAAAATLGELARCSAVLVRERWVAVSQGDVDVQLWPAHDRVRAALRDELAAPARRALARQLAEALEREPLPDTEALARQWLEAGEPRRAAGFARIAGDRAMSKLAFERAAELYALALEGATETGRAELLTVRGDALAAAGRGPAAAACYLDAAELVEGTQMDDLVLRAGDQLIRAGQLREGKQLLTRVLRQLGIRLPVSRHAALRMLLVKRLALRLRGTRPRALDDARRRDAVRRIDACWPVGTLLAVLDPVRSTAVHTQGLLFALDAGEPHRLARAYCIDAVFVSMPGVRKRAAALARLAAAAKLRDELGTPLVGGYLELGHGVVAMQCGELARAQQHLDAAELTFQRAPGAYWETATAREFAVWTLAYRGCLAELVQRHAGAVAVCDALGDRLGRFKLVAGPSRVALLARDATPELLEGCELAALGLAPEEYPFLELCAVFTRVTTLLYLGRVGDARRALEGVAAPVRLGNLMHSQFNRIELAFLRGRVALASLGDGDRDDDRGTVQRCVTALRRERVAWAEALAGFLELAARPTRDREALVASAAALEGAGLGGVAHAIRWQLALPEAWHGAGIAQPARLARALAPLR